MDGTDYGLRAYQRFYAARAAERRETKLALGIILVTVVVAFGVILELDRTGASDVMANAVYDSPL